MAYWWKGRPWESYWVEIRRIPGIGSGLESPNRDESGHRNGWYDLVGSVRAGETVYHYNARESRFVGRSVAARDAVEDPTHGRYRVELRDFTPIVAPVGLSELRARADGIYSLRDELIRLRACRHSTDRRAESYRPDTDSIRLGQFLPPDRSWAARRRWLDPLVEQTMCALVRGRKGGSLLAPSLGLVRPARVISIGVQASEDWSETQDSMRRQGSLFSAKREARPRRCAETGPMRAVPESSSVWRSSQATAGRQDFRKVRETGARAAKPAHDRVRAAPHSRLARRGPGRSGR